MKMKIIQLCKVNSSGTTARTAEIEGREGGEACALELSRLASASLQYKKSRRASEQRWVQSRGARCVRMDFSGLNNNPTVFDTSSNRREDPEIEVRCPNHAQL